MENITGILNSFKRISRKIQPAITLNKLDLKKWTQIDFALPDHDPKR
jgi:hypothetical protein